MKLLVSALLVTLALTTGFTCSKNAPTETTTTTTTTTEAAPPPAQDSMGAPAEGAAAPAPAPTEGATEAAPAPGH